MSDFGLSGVEESSTAFVGTNWYIAPEVLREEPHTKTIDWYGFGVLLYEMVAGRPPYMGKD